MISETVVPSSILNVLQEKNHPGTLRAVCEEACRMMEAQRAMVAEISFEGGETLRNIVYAHNLPSKYVEALREKSGPTLFAEICKRGEVGVISEPGSNPKFLDPKYQNDKRILEAGHRAICIIPLVKNKKPFGGLCLYHLYRRDYTLEERRLAQIFGEWASIAIEKSKDADFLGLRIEERESLEMALRRITSGDGVNDIVQAVWEEADRVMGTSRSSIEWHDSESDEISFFGCPEFSFQYGDRLAALPIPFPITRSYLSDPGHNTPTVIPDTSAHHLAGEIQVYEGLRSMVAFPLRIEGENKGSLMFYWTHPRKISGEMLALGQAFSDQVAVALHHAHQKEDSQDYAEQLQQFAQLVNEVASPPDSGPVYELAGRSGAKLLEANRWGVWLLQPDGAFQCMSSEGLSESLVRELESRGDFERCYRGDGRLQAYPSVIEEERGTNGSHHSLGRERIHSYLLLPLQNKGRKTGVIAYCFDKPVRPVRRRIEIAQLFADQAAFALENTRLFNQTQERLTHLQTVGEIVKAVSSMVEPDELFRTIVREIRRVIPCERCVISAVSGEDRRIDRWHIDSDIAVVSESSDALEAGGWFYREIYETKRLKNIPDLRESGLYWASHLTQGGLQSLLVVPILQGEEVVAHIALSSRYTHAFSAVHEKLMTEITAHLGAAIRNASLFRVAEERAGRLSTLNRIARAVSSTLDPDTIFKRILREIREAVPCERLVVSTGPPREGWEQGMYIDSDPKMEESNGDEEARRGWFSREIYDSKQVRNITRIEFSGLPWKEALTGAGFQSSLFVPIVQDDQSIAHLELYSTQAAAFSRDHEEFLRSVAFHIGSAIQNAFLYQTVENRAFRLRKLNELNRQIAGTLDLPELLNDIKEGTISLLGGDFSQLFLIEEETKILVSQPSPVEALSLQESQEPSAPLLEVIRTVVETGEPILLPDLQRDPRFIGIDWALKAGFHSFAAQPLRLGEKIIGAIFCVSRRRELFGPDDLNLLKTFADNAAIVIQNARLHENEKRSRVFFHSVVDDNSDAIIVADPQHKIILWNPAAQMLYGYTKSEALGNRVEDLILRKDERAIWVKKVDSMFSEGTVWQFEEDRIHKDGTVVPVSITLSPVKQEDGQLIAVSGIHHDLKWREQAEAALRESEERFRQYVQHAGDALIVYDLNGGIEEVNLHACRSLNYGRDELLSMNVSQVDLNYEPAEFREHWENIRSGEAITIEGLNRRQDGTTFPVEVRLGALELKGRPHFLALIRDVSDRKRAEESLRKAAEDAEAANQAKREFLSNMSHELRSPLNLITGFSDLLMMESQEKPVVEIVPKIQASAKHLASLIEDMIDLDRIERGEVNLNPEVVSINEIVTALVESRKPRLRAGFAIECILDPAGPRSFCDMTRVNQVLINLVDNAIHYSPDGGMIRIQTSVQEQEVWVSVQDEGVGLSEEEKGKIFERFFRLKHGKKRRPGGLGIGLNLVRELVRVQGGRIWVTGEKGIGSTFTFSLPLFVSEEDQDLEMIREPSGNGRHSEPVENGRPSEPAEPWAGRVILIADDDEEHHLFIRRLLGSTARVVSAYNGLEVGEWVHAERPDIILMDIRMPIQDGLTAIENLKANPGTRDIPILVVTARATPRDREDALKTGADGFLSKPVVLDDFYFEMRRLLVSGN